jgi:hypothetical protein
MVSPDERLKSGYANDLLRAGDYEVKIPKEETHHAYEFMRDQSFSFPTARRACTQS